MVLAYFTPDVALPIASVVAAGVGFVMMVGRAPFRFFRRTFRAGLDRFKKGSDPRPE